MAVLIDSSVWIAAANPKAPEYLRLRSMIYANELIYVTRFIQAEVCQGARSEPEFHRLWDSLLGFDYLEITTRHWGLSSWNYFRLRKRGKTIGTLDCVLATLSQDCGVPLWTLDKRLKSAQSTIGFDAFE